MKNLTYLITIIILTFTSCNVKQEPLPYNNIVFEEHLPNRIDTITIECSCIIYNPVIIDKYNAIKVKINENGVFSIYNTLSTIKVISKTNN